MNKSILILEENSMIHGLIASALELDGLSLHHEFDPNAYIDRVKALMPDLILISNADREQQYTVCRQLKSDESISGVPLVLLANSRDELKESDLIDLRVDGVIRKPFEASDVQQQVSKHLDLVDLIGSAYDYKKSQSLRDEGMNPLADMEVIDSEMLDMLRQTGERPGVTAPEVPEIDFSRELDTDAPVEADVPDETEQAGLAEEPGFVDESTLEETLATEDAFEIVDEAPTASDEDETVVLPDDTALDEEDISRSSPPEGQPAVSEPEGDMAELGAADILEEEAPDTGVSPPQAFDQDLHQGEAPSEEPRMDDVEMELAGADIDFAAIDEDLEEGDVPLFESELGDDAPPPADSRVREEIPEAVRRMVEMKPVLSISQETEESPISDTGVDFAPDSEELNQMAEELEALEEIPVDSEFQQPALAGDAANGLGTAVDTEKEAEEEFFHEDYLGDDELDEKKIEEALNYTAEEDEPELDVKALDDDEAYLARATEDAEITEMDSLDEIDLEESLDDDDEISIEPDEESMVLSAIETNVELEATPDVAEAESPDFAEPELELAPLEDELEPPDEPATDETGAGLIDQQLDALEQAAPAVDKDAGVEISEIEPTEETPAELAIDFSKEESGQEQEEFDSMALEIPPDDGDFPLDAEFDAPADEADTLAQADIDAPIEIEEPYISDDARAMAAFTSSEDGAMADPADTEPHEAELSFEDEFSELQAEIHANPTGEMLEDVLATEGIVHTVGDMEFQIPQHESNFARGIGILELPGEGSVDNELMESLTGAPLASVAGAIASAAGAVTAEAIPHAELLSMIEASVRRVVNEEMPKIMKRMIEETRGHGA